MQAKVSEGLQEEYLSKASDRRAWPFCPLVRQAWACNPKSSLTAGETDGGTRWFFHPRAKPTWLNKLKTKSAISWGTKTQVKDKEKDREPYTLKLC